MICPLPQCILFDYMMLEKYSSNHTAFCIQLICGTLQKKHYNIDFWVESTRYDIHRYKMHSNHTKYCYINWQLQGSPSVMCATHITVWLSQL